MILKLKSGGYRIYSYKKDPTTNKSRNPGTFYTLAAAKKHGRKYNILNIKKIGQFLSQSFSLHPAGKSVVYQQASIASRYIWR